MNNNRCVNCGFLNFASISTCKRCKVAFLAQSLPEQTEAFGGYTPEWRPAYDSAIHLARPAYQTHYFPSPVAPLPRSSKNSGTNAVLLSLLGIVVAVAGGLGVLWKFGKPAPVNYAWYEYRAKDESFTVLMPSPPIESVHAKETPMGPLDVHMALADMRSEAYLVGYSDYPESFRTLSAETILEGAQEGAIGESNSTLVSRKKITLDGYEGIEIEIKPPAGSPSGVGRAFSRIYWAPPRIFITFAGGMDTGETMQRSTKFLDSFRIQKK